jgi:hypothetical protein
MDFMNNLLYNTYSMQDVRIIQGTKYSQSDKPIINLIIDDTRQDELLHAANMVM